MALGVALFLSNIVVVSCAMAYALCNECPDHMPTICMDSCATTDVAITDKTGDVKSNVHRPAALSYTVLPPIPSIKPRQSPVAYHGYDHSSSSPPLYVQFCVFLK
jgi:hypothetical protein